MKTLETPQRSNGNIFRQYVKGNNFMTPYLVGYYAITNGEAEVTKGDFLGNTIYGVTVVQNNHKDDDLSKCCHSMDEVLEYIGELAS